MLLITCIVFIDNDDNNAGFVNHTFEVVFALNSEMTDTVFTDHYYPNICFDCFCPKE